MPSLLAPARRHPRVVDALIAGACVLFLAGPWLVNLIDTPRDAAYNRTEATGWLVVALLQTVPLFWRRTRPILTFALVALGHVAQLFAADTPMPSNLALAIATYALARHGSSRAASLLGLAVVAAAGPVAAHDWGYGESTSGIVVGSIFFSSVVIVMWVWGDLNRKRAQLVTGLQAQNEALVRERDQRARLAAEEERTRIARDMHDIVAHNLSVIVVQADGAAYAARHGSAWEREQASDALETIATTARSALADTRRLVGVLRAGQGVDDPEWAPTAGVAAISGLVEQIRAAGHEVSFEAPEPSAGRGVDGDVPPEVGLAAYRIVQESLTNVLRHAGPEARAEVSVRRDDGRLVVRVCDDGRGPQSTDGMGNGIIGMRERVLATGGALQAGPRRGGGFEVEASMPLTEEGRGD